jgi:hypothetical protein
MIWLKSVVALLSLAAISFGVYDFHLHLNNGTREEVLQTTMLTLCFGVLAGALGILAAKLHQRNQEWDTPETSAYPDLTQSTTENELAPSDLP